jgi:hypothetical protein
VVRHPDLPRVRRRQHHAAGRLAGPGVLDPRLLPRPATAVTGGGGTTYLTHTPKTNTEYRAVYAGNSQYVGSTSATKLVGVMPGVTAKASATKALNGTAVTISGSVVPAHTGSVVLQRYTSNGWQQVATTTLSSSRYAFTVRPAATGVYRYRVVKPADADHVTSWSTTIRYTAYRVAIASISASGEYAVLKNTGTTAVNLGRWVLDVGATTQRYALPSYALAPGATVKVRSGRGTTGAGVIYLGLTSGIWASPHDVGRLYDPRGALSSRLAY